MTSLDNIGRDGAWGTLHFNAPWTMFMGGRSVVSLDLDVL